LNFESACGVKGDRENLLHSGNFEDRREGDGNTAQDTSARMALTVYPGNPMTKTRVLLGSEFARRVPIAGLTAHRVLSRTLPVTAL
jgi:hypothetical protein